ncbi:primosomal protein N' [Rhodoferax sp.]|uniref:replication restart helicase PriA n=1 Tax=Rhodoferax sp. TaxID=50421 RepID=UPI0025D77B1E|nr:primosomal protein N' [Rhodoferax sp.]MCM2295998.1 primosomal protein N' [Rhodoferax sp.]
MPEPPVPGNCLTRVLVHTPAHSQMAGALSYWSEAPLPPGTLVRVPLGQRELLGVVWSIDSTSASDATLDPAKLRPVTTVLDAMPPLSAHWRDLIRFAASYYQRAAGEVALAALPPQLRDMSSVQLERRLKKLATATAKRTQAVVKPATETDTAPTPEPDAATPAVVLTQEQHQAISQFHQQPGPFLLFGATGSGKTEVFMHCTAALLASKPEAQALVMVPEINLTPQLEARFKARFCPLYGADAVVSMHSGMSPAQRLNNWLAAHSGAARVVLGTRMAVFASMPQLQLIVVDEEHDPSYKSSEGARYSARDLAIYRGHLEGAKVMLGSATPSLESWHHSRPAEEGGRYLRLEMPSRIGRGQLPLVRRVDMNHQPKSCIISAPLLAAITQRIARGEQSMVFLNRRGYAPVLQCSDCDWKSECPHCSAYRVFHKIDRTLRCHHCGLSERVPRACPACGNPDITPLGRGTERLEEHLAELLAGVQRPDGQPVRIVRIDADTTRLKGALESQLAQVHTGEVDVLVGTQMIAKGHDFRRITLVAAVNPDNALFSSDFRAPERLFSLLMQAAGRAGRDETVTNQSEMWLQTFLPKHPLYEALKKHDYPAFAASQLKERQQAAMPPFSFQALIRSEARSQEAAQGFLTLASQAASSQSDTATLLTQITLYPAVPMSMARIANIERAQMLVESPSRTALQRFLSAWQGVLHSTRAHPECKGVIRWAIDVDPHNI